VELGIQNFGSGQLIAAELENMDSPFIPFILSFYHRLSSRAWLDMKDILFLLHYTLLGWSYFTDFYEAFKASQKSRTHLILLKIFS